jgi:NAD-dependent dihydropyrimidine dehydrogenase PreA subunit
MYIDQQLCKKCLDCKPVCPLDAITLKDKSVIIDYETCVECGVCLRFEICPEGAIKQADEIPYPRIIRAVFSDPLQRHESTGILGRGTEEMKTNDVTGLFQAGKIGFSIELGRPTGGAYLRDLEKVVKKVTSMRVQFAEDNPVVPMIADRSTGALKPEILGEKVLSAIVECLVPEEEAIRFIDEMARFLGAEMECVVTMSVISRADEKGDSAFLQKLKDIGRSHYPNGKVNIGMALV